MAGEKRRGQLDLPFRETTFGKNYSKKKREEISRRVTRLFSDYTSEKILLPSEEIGKLEDMGKKSIRITSKNFSALLSANLTDDEIIRLVEFQKYGIFPETREEIFQLSSSVSESEKNIILERGQFNNYLEKDGYNWLLSNLDYLLTIYPWWKIKGLYFYTKIDNYHHGISCMDDVVYYLGSDENKPHIKEKDILLCSEITMNKWKEIRPLFDSFKICIPKKGKGSNEEFFSKLANLSGQDVRKFEKIGEYINNIGETEEDILSKINKDRNRPIVISILGFYGLLSSTQEQWEIVDQMMKEFFSGARWFGHPSVDFLLKLAALSETDILELRHCKDLGLKIDVENVSLLLSDKLNNDKIKALVKLQKYFEYVGVDYESGSYLSKGFILKVIESDEFCEFINSLDYGEDGFADRWFSRYISILLKRDFDVVSIKRLYYYFKIRSYDTNAPLDFRQYLSLNELINEYNDSPINPGVIEFVYKKGLYKNDKQQIGEQQIGEGRKGFGFFDRINEDFINTINKRGLNKSGEQKRCKDKYDTNEDLESFSSFNKIPVKVLEFIQKNVESVDMKSLEDLLSVFTEFKKLSENTYDNNIDIITSIVEKCLAGRKDLSMDIIVMIFKFICKNIDNVDLLSKRMEFGEITVDNLLEACNIIYPGDNVKNKRKLNNEHLPSDDSDDLPF